VELKFKYAPSFMAPQRTSPSSTPTLHKPLVLPKKRTAVKLASRPTRPVVDSTDKLSHLREFNKKYLGIENYDSTKAKLGEKFYLLLSQPATKPCCGGDVPDWHSTIPSRHQLWRNQFGKPDIDHSFNQTASLETTLFQILESGFLSPHDLCTFADSHHLLAHLAASIVAYRTYDFRWIRQYNVSWDIQELIDPDRQVALTAALFFFKLDASLLMRYLGNNYTAEYHDVDRACKKLRELSIPSDMISKYRRVLLTGCPNHFVAETSRENMLLYWRRRNGPTIDKKLDQVRKTMNKEDKNNFVIPLPHWTARFIPHLFLTPQHILENRERRIVRYSMGRRGTHLP
jgi:hypothetical protein